jgi:hypothetical protein
MPRLSDQDRTRNEEAIRAAMEQLLSGSPPEGGRCDLKTLAALAGVTRTGFYPKKDRHGVVRPGAYQHLADEFERRRASLLAVGAVVDPRAAQIDRLKDEITVLRGRVASRDEQIAELTAFKTTAVSRLAAQHEEIHHLRQLVRDRHRPAEVRVLADTRPAGWPVALINDQFGDRAEVLEHEHGHRPKFTTDQ